MSFALRVLPPADAPIHCVVQTSMQIPLGSIVGALRYDRFGGVTACGTLDSGTAASGTSGSFEYSQGAPVFQLDCDAFQSPSFVIMGPGTTQFDMDADSATRINPISLCNRLYDVLGHAVINRQHTTSQFQQ